VLELDPRKLLDYGREDKELSGELWEDLTVYGSMNKKLAAFSVEKKRRGLKATDDPGNHFEVTVS
jgi:hypothetical protein